MTDERIIQLMFTAIGVASLHDGQYLIRFDPDPLPHGTLYTSPDEAQAMRFANVAAAVTYLKQAHGRRPDGKPNRPLTAWTVSINPPGG
jgi:hypothetical protein